MDKNTPLSDYERVRTPRDVARYARNWNLGKEYRTHGDVWSAGESIVQTGLLHLILDELQKEPEPDPLIKHREWLKCYYPYVSSLFKEHEKQRRRLAVMFGEGARLGRDASIYPDISMFSAMYRRDRQDHYESIESIKRKISRMKSVKKPKDVTNLAGIGKKTAEKLISNMQSKH